MSDVGGSPAQDEDEDAQFIVAVGDVLVAAELADLRVELALRSGGRLAGVPVGLDGEEHPAAGPLLAFRLGSERVDLAEVTWCTLFAALRAA